MDNFIINKVIVGFEKRIQARLKYKLPLQPIKDEILKGIGRLNKLLGSLDRQK